jgi:hypothetical protein
MKTKCRQGPRLTVPIAWPCNSVNVNLRWECPTYSISQTSDYGVIFNYDRYFRGRMTLSQ